MKRLFISVLFYSCIAFAPEELREREFILRTRQLSEELGIELPLDHPPLTRQNAFCRRDSIVTEPDGFFSSDEEEVAEARES